MAVAAFDRLGVITVARHKNPLSSTLPPRSTARISEYPHPWLAELLVFALRGEQNRHAWRHMYLFDQPHSLKQCPSLFRLALV